jgi:hypothetical protein
VNVGVASSFLALARNLGMVIGVAFSEMVIGLRIPATSPGAGRGPSLEGIQDVWRILLAVGLIAIFLSWKRGKKEIIPQKL